MKLSEIAKKLSCDIDADGDVDIKAVAGIDEAGPGDLTFVSNRKYLRRIKTTRASAIILGRDAPEVTIPSLRTDNPYLAFALALEIFYPPSRPEPGIHPTARIAEGARIGPDASIGAYVVVGRDVRIGARATLHPHVVVYPGVEIGDDAVLHSHVTVREACLLGHRVTVQNGSVIGSDGFGFAPKGDGTYHKIHQAGRVVIEDDVEIGANATVDRAAVGNTVIRRGAKIDNLVQIGHGSQVGENTVVAAQAGLAGSTRLGRGVQVGGQVGFAGHLEVGDGAVFTAQTGVPHDVDAGAVVSGYPAIDNAAWRRSSAVFARLPELQRKVRELEKEVALLKEANPAKNPK